MIIHHITPMSANCPVVTVVIPCFWSDYLLLLRWLKDFISISDDTVRYVVVLNGFGDSDCIDLYQSSILSYIKVASPLTPGEARNIALSSIKSGHVAFLDVRTIPSSDWISSLLQFCYTHPQGSQIGSVLYVPTRPWHYPLLSSTYGHKAMSSLPGSVFHISAIHTNGFFLPGFRAGEDLDWLWRIKSRSLAEPYSSPPLFYFIDANLGLFFYLRKWFRNYSHSSLLPYINRHQRLYYSFFLLFSFVILSFFWNNVFAGWNVDSPLYIPYVTRFTLGYALTIYSCLRCIYLPVTKGLSAFSAICQAPIVLIFSFLFDISKLLAFVTTTIASFARYD